MWLAASSSSVVGIGRLYHLCCGRSDNGKQGVAIIREI